MELSLDAVLSSLEDDTQILEYRLGKDELLLWPFVRHSILLHLIYHNQGIPWAPDSRPLSTKEKAKNVFYSIFRSPLRLIFEKKPLLYFNSGIANYPVNGVFHNRLVDDFYFAFRKESALIESLRNGRVSYPRSHSDVYTHLGFKAIQKIISPFYSYVDDKRTAESLYNFLRLRLKDLPVKESTWEQISNILRADYKYLVVEYTLFRWYFQKVKPKLIIVEDAFHGYYGHIAKAAQDLGITVAEFQHGTINSKHLAYNYGDALIVSHEYIKYTPEIFLSYGPFWTRGLRNSAKNVSVGNPFISQQIGKHDNNTSNKNILVLSAGVSEERIRLLITKLLDLQSLKDYIISLRLHPLEKNPVGAYSEFSTNRFVLDSESTIFESLEKSNIVISEYSTAAFDALMFGKPVLLYKTEMMKMATEAELEYFKSFTLDELNGELLINELKTHDKDLNEVCDKNWQLNFKNFINQYLNS